MDISNFPNFSLKWTKFNFFLLTNWNTTHFSPLSSLKTPKCLLNLSKLTKILKTKAPFLIKSSSSSSTQFQLHSAAAPLNPIRTLDLWRIYLCAYNPVNRFTIDNKRVSFFTVAAIRTRPQNMNHVSEIYRLFSSSSSTSWCELWMRGQEVKWLNRIVSPLRLYYFPLIWSIDRSQ